jgi:hydrogenase maturation protein HypF
MWLEQIARAMPAQDCYPFPYNDHQLDFRPLLQSIMRDRLRSRRVEEIARAFQLGVAQGLRDAVIEMCKTENIDTVVLSGGVFQNELLLEDLKTSLPQQLRIWTNHAVPPNDGGISLGQAAIAAFERNRPIYPSGEMGASR